MKKYFTEIMSQIKKTGMYFLESKEREKLLKLNAKIYKLKEKNINLSDENNFLESKHRYKPSDNGYGYIAETTCINNGKVSVCYKFGVTDDIAERIKKYRTGNPRFKLLFYIPLKIDMYILESCINSVLKPHEIKSKNETYSFVSLKELKNIINECAKIITMHI